MFNNFVGKKEKPLLKSQKSHFSIGVNPCFWLKMQYFLYLFSVKIGLKISFNNGLDRKETFLFV